MFGFKSTIGSSLRLLLTNRIILALYRLVRSFSVATYLFNCGLRKTRLSYMICEQRNSIYRFFSIYECINFQKTAIFHIFSFLMMKNRVLCMRGICDFETT